MTLTEYEAAVQTLPGYQRGQAAGPAHALRELLRTGEAFIASRDRIVSMRQHHEPLSETGQLANFAGLTGA
jgi:hypothetical protein